jgi:hypothetical protein
MRIAAPSAHARGGGGNRGKVTTFSRASRLRLLDLFSRMNSDNVRTTFLTLTFTGTPAPDSSKQALKRFLMRIRYNYPAASGVWRLEYQQRGAPHYHLIMFNLPYWPQHELQETWEECTREERSIVHIKLLHGGKRHIMSYVSKYVAKAGASLDYVTYQQIDDPESIGRQWGYINFEALPFAIRAEIIVSGSDIIDYLYHCVHVWSRGKCANGSFGARAYVDDGEGLVRWLASHADSVYYLDWCGYRVDDTVTTRHMQ